MTEKVSVELIDDLDGSPATQTIDFSLDGQAYTIDLNRTHARQLRELLRGYAQHAHRRPSPTAPHQQRQRQNTKTTNKAITQRIRDLASRHRPTVPENHPQEQHNAPSNGSPSTRHDTQQRHTHEDATEATDNLFLAAPARTAGDHTNNAGKPQSAPAPAALFTSAP